MPEKEKSSLKNAGIIIAVFILLFTILATILYYNRKTLGIKIKPMSPDAKAKIQNDIIKSSYANVKLIIATGGRTSLAINMAIPCEHRKQKSQIYRNLVRIENDAIMEIEDNKIYNLAVERNYTELKKVILGIINSYLDEPVNQIYFNEIFILDQ